jgi:nitrogen regulatory protein P-II 2
MSGNPVVMPDNIGRMTTGGKTRHERCAARFLSKSTRPLPNRWAQRCRRFDFSQRSKTGTALAALVDRINQGGPMKLVTAIIKPFKLDEVREAVSELGVTGMTVTEVKGFGRQKGQTEIYRGAEYTTNMVPKLKVEVACSSDMANRVVEAIQAAANTGAIGDGKIFVSEIGQAVRIRTGETDNNAL